MSRCWGVEIYLLDEFGFVAWGWLALIREVLEYVGGKENYADNIEAPTTVVFDKLGK